MKLYAAGFNAWHQLSFVDEPARAGPGEPDDLATFTCVLEDARIDGVCPSLTCTQVVTSRGVLAAGAAAGATAGAADALDTDRICCEALNGRVVVYSKREGVVRQYASAQHMQVEEFAFPLPHVVQIVAYNVGFAALVSPPGQVWTWGDGRFAECLGRDVDAAAAERPGLVSALEGLPTGPISKIAGGGYAFAALTQEHDMYCWGRYIGRQQHRPVLAGLGGEPEPVVVAHAQDELDTVDVGIGDAHMIVLASDGCVHVVGSNANGQLGLGRDVEDTAPSSWARVEGIPAHGQTVTGVYAGPRSSFIVVDG